MYVCVSVCVYCSIKHHSIPRYSILFHFILSHSILFYTVLYTIYVYVAYAGVILVGWLVCSIGWLVAGLPGSRCKHRTYNLCGAKHERERDRGEQPPLVVG